MRNFYKGKKVLVTGHTGFKGTWLCKMLVSFGAQVTGYALSPPTTPSVFQLSGIEKEINSVIDDIRNFESLKKVFDDVQPEIVIHLAAQPIVRDSYKDPRYTYEVNVMGTINILECIRTSKCVRSFLNVTTDKVYRNNEWCWAYREDEYLDGYDPYSNSKSCSELVTSSYKNSFFSQQTVAISTARAGNVIGGGDFANDRIIPDCIKSVKQGKEIIVRNPYSVRPYQHVLEPLYAYLLIVKKQYENIAFSGNYNIGPDDCDCVTTGDLVTLFCETWGKGASWKKVTELNAPHEANFLKLDCSKAKSVLGWRPYWNIDTAIEKICEWTKIYFDRGNIAKCMDAQILEFLKCTE